MSDSDESGITYTEVSSPFEDLSDIGSPRADDHEYLELPEMPEDPYEPEQAPPSPDYVPGPEHTDDEIVAKDQPDAEDASPTVQSPDYVPESDPEEDPEEDDDEDPEEDPVDYSADRGDDRDDEDEPSEEDKDDDVDMEADGDKEEEEHLVPANSVVVALPATDQAPSAEETEPFETDEFAATPTPHPSYRMTARISIPAPVPTPLWSDAEIPSPSLPLSPRKRLGIALGLGYEVRESSSAAAARPDGGLRADYGFIATMDREIRRNPEREIGYGITDSWDEIVETLQGALVSTDTELVQYMTAFETRVRQDTDEVYTSDLAHAEVMSLRTTVLAQMSEIRELQDADRKRQAVISEMLKAEQRRSAEMRELGTADHTR
ncbi:hypothetical protein Tco_0013335 [Tanacetum coccineum]